MKSKTAKEVLSYANKSKGDYYWFIEKPEGGIARGGYADKSDIKSSIQQWDADGYIDCKTGKFFSPEGTVFSNPKAGRSVSVTPEESRDMTLRDVNHILESMLAEVSKKDPEETVNGKKGQWRTTKKTVRKIFFPKDKSGPIGGGLKFAKAKKKSKK